MPSENLNSETILPELYFLVAHFFNDSRFKEYIQPLIRQLELHQVLPPRIDWQGNKHPRSFDELIRHNQHISPNHLLKLLNQLRIVTDSLCDNRLGSIDSLLGQGQYSLIQDIERLNNVRKGVQSKWTNVEAIPKDLYCKYTPLPPNAAAAVTQANSPFGTTNLILNLSRRELGANMPPNHIVQPEYFRTVNLHKRILGHLSCVYCVCFDRTGRYILTGADDNLIKAWSSSDGRLLATFRGHDKEISDIDLNYENTLMASGSCDKMIRIWNLRTTESTTVLQGHTSAVSNVEFSPYCKGNTRWLASSGNDGLICFWQWSSQTLHFNPKPKKFIEKSRPGSQMLCLSFSAGGFFMAAGSNDHAIRVYYMDDDEPKKLHELECHSNWVDSILYANRSAHFLSGSKDGTAVIWRLDENNRWKGDLIDGSKTLQRSEPDEFSHLDIHKRYPVTMVAWNCDDTLVITSQTNLVIKVWSTNPIDLVHELRGHTDEIYVLEAHPRDPRILLSASHDGHLMLWNLLTGKLIRKFYNRVDNEGHACFFDTKWSPTLDLFASTDSHGSLSIFGLGSDEPYKKCPSEQFFHTDYRPLMGDAHSFVVDEQTQQPPHLMPPPFLVNSEGNPYESDLQRLVPGRENLTHAQLIPHVVTHENGLSEIIGDRAAEDDDDDDVAANRPSTSGALNHSNANPRPSNAATAAANSANRLLWLKDFIRPLDIELLRTSEMNRLERLEHEESQHLHGIRSMMERNKQTHQVYVFRELESPLKNTDSRRRRGMPSSGLYSTRRRDLDVYEDETNQSLQPPPLHHDENTEDHYVNVDGEEDSNTQFSATNGPTTSAAASATTSHRLTSFTNAIQSIRARNGEPYSRNTMTSRAAAAQPAQSDLASSNDSASESYSDWSEEDGHRRVTKNPRRSQTARPTIVKTRSGRISTRRIVKRPEEDEDMDTAGLDTTATADEPSIIGKRKPGRPSRKTKKVLMSDDDEPTTSAAATATATSSRSLRKTATTTGEESDEEDESSNENSSDDEDDDDDMDMDEEFDKPCTSNQANKSSSGGKKKKRPGRKSKSRNKTTDNVNLNDAIAQECPKEYRPPEWLTSTKARKSPYVPQIGDEVVYFRQGHELYLEAVQNQNAYELKDEDTLPSVDVADVQEFCRVLDVHVEIRPPRLVCLKLSTQSNKRFKVRYHDMPNVVDFVILRQTYERGIERHWKPKERFKSLIDDLWYIGCVEAKLPFQDEHPECEFQSLRIVWDTGEEEAMSPWDLEPLSGVNSRKVKPVMAAASSGVGGTEPTPVTPEELKSLLYVPDSDEWPEHGRDQECERILTGLETIMQLSIAEHFNYPVDLDAYPRYAMAIGYPIDLNTIKERLENRYYRRLSALQWDVRLIQTNATKFNVAKSEIVQRATLLTSLLLEFIDDQYCTNPMPIYKRMCQSSGGGTPSTNNKRTAVTNGVKTRHQEAAESQQKPSTTKASTSAATSNLQFKLRPRDTRGAIGGRHSTRQHRDDDAHKTTAEVVAKWWHSEARQLVEDIFDHPDADPFLEPVDTKKYSDYLHFVETPMDFGLVRGFLAAGKYKELRDFDNDCRLVFRNSKAYTTDRNSQIYTMTRRLERYYNNRISEIFRNQESTLSELPRHSKLRSTRYTGGGNMYVSSSRDRSARDDYHQRETRGGRPTRQTSKYFDPDLYDDHSNAATTSTTKQARSSRHHPGRRHKVIEDDEEEEDDDESQQNDEEVDEEPTTSRRRRDETSTKKEPETTARVEENAEQDEDNVEYDLNEAYLSTSNVDTSAVAAKKELDTSTETSEAVAPVKEEKESQERRHSGLDDDSDEEKEETKQRKRAGKVDDEDEYEDGHSDEKGSDEDEDDEEGSNEEASDFESSNDDDDDDDDDDEDFGKSSKKKRKKNNVDKKKSKSKRGRKKGSSKQSSKGLSHSNNSRGASSSKTATKTSSTTKSSIMTRHHHSSTRSADNKENDETTVSRGMSSRGKESAAAASSSGSSSMMLSARSSSRRAKRTHCYREYTSDEAEDNVDEDDDDDNELTIDSIDDASRRTRRSGLVNGTSSSASKRARIVHDEEANHAYGLDHLESNNPMRISSRTRVRTSR